MANIKDYIKKIQDGTVSLEEQQQALAQVEQTIVAERQKREEAIGKNVDMVIAALRTIEDRLNAKYQELLNTPAMVGEQGPQGESGKCTCSRKAIVITENYTVLDDDYYIGCRNTKPIEVTLPSTPNDATELIIKFELGTPVVHKETTIVTSDGSLIDGSTTRKVKAPYRGIHILYRAGGWFVISEI